MPRIPVILQQAPQGSTNPATNSGRIGKPLQSMQTKGPAFAREHFSDRQQNTVQRNARVAMSQATSSDDAAANVIRGVSFTANVTQLITHGLTDSKGRPIAWTSYRIENVQTTFARFFAAHVSAVKDASYIAVTADANCICDVRVW